jgi:outer membrane receptor for ferrienterochelin and colicin
MRVVTAGILVACFATSAIAQVQQAVIEGVVVDASGLPVPGASVDLRTPATNQVRSTVTDAIGGFRLTNLPPGTYTLRVVLAGFAPYEQRDLVLAVAQLARLRVTLSPGPVEQSVSVSGQTPSIDVARTSVSTVIDTERVEELPVRSRNYLEFVLLAPAVVPSQPGGGRSGATTAALPDSGFSFAGLRPRSNLLTIDGLDNNDEVNGASRTELSLEIVHEFQVVSNGWSAESGGASGGAINVVTKSGANVMHGDAFLFAQEGWFNAQPKLEDTFGERPSLTRYRGGVAFGGPAVKDRTFYYVAGEQEYARSEAASDLGHSTPSTINAFLAGGGLPRLATHQLTIGLFPTALDETELSGKVTHHASDRQSLELRVAGTRTTESADAFNTGGLTDLSARGTSRVEDAALTGAWTSILGSRMTNEVRGQLAVRRFTRHTADQVGVGILIPGVAEFGRPYSGNDHDDQTYAQVADTFAMAGRHHFVKVGGTLTRVSATLSSLDGSGGLFVFPTLDALLNGQPESYRQTFGGSTLGMETTRVGVFAQDHWTPVSSLTLDVGIRFDADALPSQLRLTDRQLQPRVGLAWTPHSHWVVRGGGGIFADRFALASLVRPLALDGRNGFEQVVTGDAAAEVLTAFQGAAPVAPLAGVTPSIYTVRPGQWSPSSRQAAVGVETEIRNGLTLSVNYLFVRGHALPRTVNVNLAAPVTEADRPVFGDARLDPRRDGIFELQPTAASTYHGVTLTANRRLSHEIEWTTSYTWSHATDTASDFDEQPENPYALAGELSDSRYDERHRFVASALFDLPIGDEEDRKPGQAPRWWERAFGGIELAPIVTVGSGRPVNPLIGSDVGGTHAFPFTDRPAGLARNSLRLPASASVDLRLLKSIAVKPHGKLDLVVEGFNILNRTNVTALNTTYGLGTAPLPSFGRPIDAGTARHMQFSIDFEF